MTVLLFFLFGLFIGSFLLVVIDRFESKESFLKGRSHCEQCKHVLGPLDLIPVLSYLSTGGKCRYCKAKLSLEYPLFELLTGSLFAVNIYVLSSMYFVLSGMYVVQMLFSLYIVATLLLIFFIDLKYGIIPFKVIMPAIIFTFVYILLNTHYIILPNIYASLGGAFFFLLLFLFTKGRGMGFGDVVYMIFMGLLLGYPNIIVGLYIAFLSGAVISLFLIWQKKKKLKGSTIPFGPFLVLGTYIAWLWGTQIVTAVMSFLYHI